MTTFSASVFIDYLGAVELVAHSTKLTSLGNGVFASPTQRHRGSPMKTDALKVVILLLILALCFLLFLGVRAQAQETNDQVVLGSTALRTGK